MRMISKATGTCLSQSLQESLSSHAYLQLIAQVGSLASSPPSSSSLSSRLPPPAFSIFEDYTQGLIDNDDILLFSYASQQSSLSTEMVKQITQDLMSRDVWFFMDQLKTYLKRHEVLRPVLEPILADHLLLWPVLQIE